MTASPAPDDPVSLPTRIAAVLQLAVPMLTAGGMFIFRGDAQDLNDPNLPFVFRLAKDLAFSLAVVLPFAAIVLTRAVAIPPLLAALSLVPMTLGLSMMAIGTWKAGAGFAPTGIVRNLSVYYVLSAGIALLAWWRGYTLMLFRVFRLLMALSVLLGLAFYAFADNILYFTIHGRMIGTLANPNFLGFLCVLWLVLIHAEAAHAGRLGGGRFLEMTIAVLGLVGSASLAALLTLVVWVALVLALRWTGVLPSSRGLRHAFVSGSTIFVFAAIVGVAFLVTSDALQLIGRFGLVAAGQSETSSVRLIDLLRTFAGLAGLKGMLIGQTVSSQYIQFDGTHQTFLYNFGLPFFLLWLAFLCTPLIVAVRSWRRWADEAGDADWIALLLVPFLAVSIAVEFWIQYVADRYPTSIIFGIVMYFLVLHALPVDRRRALRIGAA